MSTSTIPSPFSWGHEALTVEFVVTDGRIGVNAITLPGGNDLNPPPVASPASIVEVRTVSQGSNGGHQHLHSSIGDRLRYLGHDASERGGVAYLDIRLHDPVTLLDAVVSLSSPFGRASMTASTTVTNRAGSSTTLLTVSALMLELVDTSASDYDDYRLHWARNDWTKECRWQSDSIVDLLVPDLAGDEYSIESRRPFGISGLGTWSSGRYLPMGMLENLATGFAAAWQIENPGPWRWEVGDRRRSLVVGTFGPLDLEHHWNRELSTNESFTTPDVTFAFGSHGWQSAIAELTQMRRARRLPHASFDAKPVVYNDFFALFAEPTEQNLAPLIAAASDIGAEVFCIDAGWFDGEHGGVGGGAEGGHGWWDALGEYEESPWRFPNGFALVVQSIRDAGMIPGIWLEPEVVGVRSAIASTLPLEAFFVRNGERVVEHGRYQLDLSHPAARAYADGVVDQVLNGYGFGYLKVDYNINPGAGTDAAGPSAGDGLWAHSRAVLDWFAGLQERHPDVIIMNCGSGGMRMDGAIQRVTHVQQMSDQALPLPFAQIAVGAPTIVPSDQAASWMSINGTMSTDLLEFAGVAPQLSRFELSGPIDTLSDDQRAIVREAIAHYREVRADICTAEMAWPWGLPRFADDWLTLAQRTPTSTRVSVWRRRGDRSTAEIDLPWLAGSGMTERVSFPSSSAGSVHWNDSDGRLTVTLPRSPMALVIELS
jgi:alpha-galactosidase